MARWKSASSLRGGTPPRSPLIAGRADDSRPPAHRLVRRPWVRLVRRYYPVIAAADQLGWMHDASLRSGRDSSDVAMIGWQYHLARSYDRAGSIAAGDDPSLVISARMASGSVDDTYR